MDCLLLIILTLPIIYSAIKKKKTYLYILCAFYPILPDTFAIELSNKLPLLTVNRILLIIGFLYVIYIDKWKIRVKLPRYFTIFILIEFIIQFINLRYGISEIKNLIIIVLEKFVLVYILVKMVVDADILHKCVGFVVYGSIINAISGVFQTVFSFDITKPLQLVAIRSEGFISPRMGLDRAFGFFQGNAISFGCFCVFAILLAEYMYGHTKKNIYLFALIINIIALFCSMTRSAMLSLGIIYLCRIIYNFRTFITKYLIWIFFGGVILIVLVFLIPSMQVYLVSIKSIINIFGANFELSSDFGLNANNPSDSRLFQWSGVVYMIREMKGLFGYGYTGYEREAIYYYYSQYNCWAKANALDVGFVGISFTYGLVGLFNYIVVFINLFKNIIKSNKYYSNFSGVFRYELLLIVMLNIASSFMNLGVLWLFIGMLISYSKLNNKTRCYYI